MKYKYVQGIQCPYCDEKIWSKYRHDFHYCSCGYCFVDGGRDYLRNGYGLPFLKEKDWIPPPIVRIRVSLEEYSIAARYNGRWPY